MMGRLRLVDAVAIAAGALLCLKLLGLASGSRASDVHRPEPGLRSSIEPALPFGNVLARARTNYQPPEVPITGSNPRRPACAMGA